jgi:hypothetical protein
MRIEFGSLKPHVAHADEASLDLEAFRLALGD